MSDKASAGYCRGAMLGARIYLKALAGVGLCRSRVLLSARKKWLNQRNWVAGPNGLVDEFREGTIETFDGMPWKSELTK
jgi:hypothetical protein